MIQRLLLPLLLSLIAGSITACAFAPWHQPELALIGILLMICVWRNARGSLVFWTGFCFGLGEFTTGISWVQISIHNFGGTTVAISVAITALFIIYLSLFPAFTGLVWAKYRRKKHPVINYLILLPSLWVFFDWLRGILFTGFPWLFPGYSFIDLPLRGWAPLLSIYGVSWLGICSVCVLFLFINQRNNLNTRRIVSYLAIWAVIWLGGWGLDQIEWSKPSAPAIRATLIQGDIPFKQKWSLQGIEQSLETYFKLTKNFANSNVVIWPETAISVNQNNAHSFLSDLNKLGQQSHTAIATGILWQVKNEKLFNAVTALGWQSHGVYLKRHLVPFGEYEPYPAVLAPIFKALNIPMSDLDEGPMAQDLLTIGGQAVSAFICYEVAYPSLVVHSSKKAAWLLTVSDDSWFGHSWASAQQLQMAQMRSLELSRDMAYATSNGITAFINSKGDVTKRAPEFVQAALTQTIQPRNGSTPIAVYGPFVIIALLMIAILISCYICAGTKENP